MVVSKDLSQDDVDRLFRALADATRRDIVTRVMASGESVSSLAERYAMSFAAVQKHVAVLERAHLVRKQRNGREQIVHGDVDAVRAATRLLEGFEKIWRQRVNRMDDILATDEPSARGRDRQKE
ncbi:helix-turn-helix domain-containing protein [Cnuibacter physcomitrellae]|uniref:ArsR/SmtB family transcription factor n=1 Tax=Cnuibacter physcomitrellae TaxID=1619308 RepID=UPI0021761607|nr:helix-turn-helix domain-containing protein [Cnuibacter physcomitrellae]MCS5497234.1 helix-turn-helix domain-containing protein [Cnuibacter physcomitrellae]